MLFQYRYTGVVNIMHLDNGLCIFQLILFIFYHGSPRIQQIIISSQAEGGAMSSVDGPIQHINISVSERQGAETTTVTDSFFSSILHSLHFKR